MNAASPTPKPEPTPCAPPVIHVDPTPLEVNCNHDVTAIVNAIDCASAKATKHDEHLCSTALVLTGAFVLWAICDLIYKATKRKCC